MPDIKKLDATTVAVMQAGLKIGELEGYCVMTVEALPTPEAKRLWGARIKHEIEGLIAHLRRLYPDVGDDGHWQQPPEPSPEQADDGD